jgi:ABC-2 type transport system permease protein
VPDRAAAEAALRDGTLDAVLIVPADLSGPGEVVVHEEASQQVQAIATGAVISLRAADAAPLLVPPTVVALEPPTDEDFTALIFANAGIIIMFIGIFSYGTWVLTGVVEEKQSRVVEVVLSTVRPRDLLMGKVFGIGALALAQLVVLVAAGIIAAQISGRLVLPPTTVGAVVQLLTWFLLGFALYSTAMGFLGSLASRMEEASNASMPVTMVATACYLASILLVSQEPDGILAQVLTFFPPAAPMVVPLRVALDAIQPWEIGLSIALMVATIWVLFVVGARVYAGAVLQTGGRMKLRDAWRART